VCVERLSADALERGAASWSWRELASLRANAQDRIESNRIRHRIEGSGGRPSDDEDKSPAADEAKSTTQTRRMRKHTHLQAKSTVCGLVRSVPMSGVLVTPHYLFIYIYYHPECFECSSRPPTECPFRQITKSPSARSTRSGNCRPPRAPQQLPKPPKPSPMVRELIRERSTS